MPTVSYEHKERDHWEALLDNEKRRRTDLRELECRCEKGLIDGAKYKRGVDMLNRFYDWRGASKTAWPPSNGTQFDREDGTTAPLNGETTRYIYVGDFSPKDAEENYFPEHPLRIPLDSLFKSNHVHEQL